MGIFGEFLLKFYLDLLWKFVFSVKIIGIIYIILDYGGEYNVKKFVWICK